MKASEQIYEFWFATSSNGRTVRFVACSDEQAKERANKHLDGDVKSLSKAYEI